MPTDTIYTIAVLNRRHEYVRIEVPELAYMYIKQLEAYIKYPERSRLKDVYRERFPKEQTVPTDTWKNLETQTREDKLKEENERLRKTIEDVLTRKVSSSVRAILRIALLADTKGPS